MMLWDRTKQLPKEHLKRVEALYQDNFPLEVRLQLSTWIEERFDPSLPFVLNNPEHQMTACSLAQELLSQLDSAIAQMPNDPDKFLAKKNLSDVSDSLKVSEIWFRGPINGLIVLASSALVPLAVCVFFRQSLDGLSFFSTSVVIRIAISNMKMRLRISHIDLILASSRLDGSSGPHLRRPWAYAFCLVM